MSTITIPAGELITLDPSDKKVIVFDFDTLNLATGVQLTSYVLTITALRQSGVTALTADNAGLVTGNRKVSARFLATTATLRDAYRVSVKGITNESPVQEKEYSIFIQIEER